MPIVGAVSLCVVILENEFLIGDMYAHITYIAETDPVKDVAYKCSFTKYCGFIARHLPSVNPRSSTKCIQKNKNSPDCMESWDA